MEGRELSPDAEDTVQQVMEQYPEAMDYRVDGGDLLVDISVENNTADHFREVPTATPGMKQLNNSQQFTYNTSQFNGRDSDGRWQFTLRFFIDEGH